MIYDEINKELFNKLTELKDFYFLNEHPNYTSFFGISSIEDKKYTSLLSRFEAACLAWLEQAVILLCKKHGIQYFSSSTQKVRTHDVVGPCDVFIRQNSASYPIVFLGTGDIPSSRIHQMFSDADASLLVVLALNDSQTNNNKVQFLHDRILKLLGKNITVMTFWDFVRQFFGDSEIPALKQNCSFIREKSRDIIGQRLISLCTDEQKAKFLEELNDYISGIDYKSLIEQASDARRSLREYQIAKIIKNYINEGRFGVLLGEREFAQSFFTAEWFFKNYSGRESLDNVFITVDYYKTIEQLLWDIAFIIGKGKIIGSGRNEFVIGDDEDKHTALEDFCRFIKDNNDLCDTAFSENDKKYLMSYLRHQIIEYKNNYRNGYVHKHNLEPEKVSIIREKTFLLVALILGILSIDEQTVLELRKEI